MAWEAVQQISSPKLRSQRGNYRMFIILFWELLIMSTLILSWRTKLNPLTPEFMMHVFVDSRMSSTIFRYLSPLQILMTSSVPKRPSSMIKIIASRKKSLYSKDRKSKWATRWSTHRVEDWALKFSESLKIHSLTTIIGKVLTRRMQSYAKSLAVLR